MVKSTFQHYVPRFYLERFININGKLWVFNKIRNQIFQTSPKNIAGEIGFYDIDEFKKIGLDPLLMEKQLAEMESETRAITENWLVQFANHTVIPIPNINREIFSRFLAIQLLRTAEFRIILSEFADYLTTNGHIEEGIDTINDVRDMHTSLLWDSKTLNDMSNKIVDCIWIFAHNQSSQPFFTSDNPALIKNHKNEQWLLATDLFERGMYIVYPLSPWWILYCYDRHYWKKLETLDGFVSPVRFTTDMVNHENSGQIGRSTRCIFSNSNDFSFAQEYLGDYPIHSDANRERFQK